MAHRTNIGTGRRAAYALAVFPLDVVHRKTIRAMLPRGRRKHPRETSNWTQFRRGEGRHTSNAVSEEYQYALKRFAEAGWIDQGQTFLRIRDRGALLDYALDRLEEVPEYFIETDRVIELLEQELKRPKDEIPAWQQRERELLAIRELMKSAVQGVHWSGRGSVRFIPKGKAL